MSTAMDEQCCCGLHIRDGSRVFAGLTGVFAIFGIAGSFSQTSSGVLFGDFLVFVIGFLCAIFVFLGIDRENPSYLLPYVVYQWVNVVLSLLTFVVTVFAMISPSYFKNGMDTETYDMLAGSIRVIGTTILVISLLNAVFCYYAAGVVNRCREYLTARAAAPKYLA